MASWFTVFYLITSNILGTCNTPYTLSSVEYIPSTVFYLVTETVPCLGLGTTPRNRAVKNGEHGFRERWLLDGASTSHSELSPALIVLAERARSVCNSDGTHKFLQAWQLSPTQIPAQGPSITGMHSLSFSTEFSRRGSCSDELGAFASIMIAQLLP
ncbi:hypothetical protein BDY19DRAFT_909132 [Irpex rosettiformis]|uniref:Uncharacterized protein n=1 Tax=Irpex rosettiformis TaxID=378272 RepID=A0ACB8TTS0_9APHY|nr:hypothetical protein BDY19DRAFT_909132 [Irpex rosettiformis]